MQRLVLGAFALAVACGGKATERLGTLQM